MKTYDIMYRNLNFLKEKKHETVDYQTFAEAFRHAHMSTIGGMEKKWEIESIVLKSD